MRFEQKYSSSTGNLYIVTNNKGKRLLIECGVRWGMIQQALNYNLTDVVGCIVSHEHADHSRATTDVMNAGINVFASLETFKFYGLRGFRRTYVLEDKTVVDIQGGEFKVRAFETNHDAAEPLGFVIKADDEYLLFATDTAYIKQRFKFPFNIIAIECSYDAVTLSYLVENNQIEMSVAKRLLKSHMSKQNTMKYINNHCDLSKCREIHLLHLSGLNINAEQTKTEFEKRFFVETKVKDDECLSSANSS